MAAIINISTPTELLRIPSDKLMFITASGNFSKVYNTDGHCRLVSQQLGQIESIIVDQLGEDQTPFLRIGRSLIVHRDYIYDIDTTNQTIVITNYNGQYYTQTASKQALMSTKYILEDKKP